MSQPQQILNSILQTANYESTHLDHVHFCGHASVLPSRFRIAEAGAAAIAATGLLAADLFFQRTNKKQEIKIDIKKAACAMRSNMYMSIRTQLTKDPWSPLSGFYKTREENYIQLHCNFPHHATGVAKVLTCAEAKSAIAEKILKWEGQELEDALAAANMCAGLVRTPVQWAGHPQAKAIASLPLLEIIKIGESTPEPLMTAIRPLSDIKVLDLTRVIAGPITGRTLAEHGATVMQISSPNLPNIESLVIDTGIGKLACFLDLTNVNEKQQLKELIQRSDIFCQAYRPGALAARGFSPLELAAIRPGIIYVDLSAYSHLGPWAERRGFDSLVQSVSGIAYEHAGGLPPKHLPAQVIDYLSGYLGAFGAMVALQRRAIEGGSYHVRLSLAQTGHWFSKLGRITDESIMQVKIPGTDDIPDYLELHESKFGIVEHLSPVVEMSQTPAHWELPPAPLGTHTVAQFK